MARLLQSLLLVLCLLATGASAEVLKAPPPGPVTVKVGLAILDFDKIDSSSSTYSTMAYLFQEWKDPRQAFPSKDPQEVREVSPSELWLPRLEIVNAVKYELLSPPVYEVRSDGTVFCKSHFSATLTSQMNLQRFPFDHQDLPLILQPALSRANLPLILEADTSKTALSPDAFHDEWKFGSLTAQISKSKADPSFPEAPCVVFKLHIDRNANFFGWKVILQMGVMVILSWVVLLLKPTEVEAALSVSVTLLLTLVAFGISVDNLIPRIGYRTWLDNYRLLCFFMIFLSALDTITMYLFHQWGYEDSLKRLRLISKIAFPTTFLGTLLILWLTLK